MVEPAATLVPVGETEATVRAGRGAAEVAAAWLCAGGRRPRTRRRRRRGRPRPRHERPPTACDRLRRAGVFPGHSSGDSTGAELGPRGPIRLNCRGDGREPARVGHLGPVGLPDVEGVNHHFAQGGDPGRDHVEVRLEEGPGDPVQQPDLVGGPHLEDGGRLGGLVVHADVAARAGGRRSPAGGGRPARARRAARRWPCGRRARRPGPRAAWPCRARSPGRPRR